jgi:phage terminase large subunit-like protein
MLDTAVRDTIGQWSRSGRPLVAQVRPRTATTPLYCTRPVCDGRPHGPYRSSHARSDQLPSTAPVLCLRGGRGLGKTWCGSAWACWSTYYVPEVAVIAPSHRHLREICVEGPSGILRQARRLGRSVTWEPSRGLVSLDNGARIWTYSAEDEDRLRGGNFGAAWLDEPAVVPHIERLWEVLRYSVRVGPRIRYLLTTTPRPSRWIKEISVAPTTELRVVSTMANAANLSPDFLASLEAEDPGSRLYRQEILGEILEDVAGALLTWQVLDDTRAVRGALPDMVRVVVGVDPSGGSGARADETGIVVVGLGTDGHLYVLADESGRYTASEWAAATWRAFDLFGASAVIAERNYGGDMVAENLRAARRGEVDRIKVVTSRISKIDRAVPIAAKFEQGSAHLVGTMPELETQLTGWIPAEGRSPDRLDAFVHAARELVGTRSDVSISVPTGRIPNRYGWTGPSDRDRLSAEMMHGLGIFSPAVRARLARGTGSLYEHGSLYDQQ